MRMSNIVFIAWFIIVVTLDKFVQSYYNIILLAISGICIYTIHKVNMKERAKVVKEPEHKEM